MNRHIRRSNSFYSKNKNVKLEANHIVYNKGRSRHPKLKKTKIYSSIRR